MRPEVAAGQKLRFDDAVARRRGIQRQEQVLTSPRAPSIFLVRMLDHVLQIVGRKLIDELQARPARASSGVVRVRWRAISSTTEPRLSTSSLASSRYWWKMSKMAWTSLRLIASRMNVLIKRMPRFKVAASFWVSACSAS